MKNVSEARSFHCRSLTDRTNKGGRKKWQTIEIGINSHNNHRVPDNKAASRAKKREASRARAASKAKAPANRAARRAACQTVNKTKEEAAREGIPDTSSI